MALLRRLCAALPLLACSGAAPTVLAAPGPIEHVLLLSVDGLHPYDVDWYVRHHPQSNWARLVHEGHSFSNAHVPFPSDSIPGLLAQITGGHPATTGVYYDDSYSRTLLPAGTTDCHNGIRGAEVSYVETLDRNPQRLDAGQGIPNLYSDLAQIAQLSGKASDLIDPVRLPVNPADCAPVYPHSYLRVNTVFEVAHSHGLRTAWADKHPAYDLVNGPSGRGVDDLFCPEIDSSITDPKSSSDRSFVKDNLDTQRYDGFKVQAVLNWIHGHDHAGRGEWGTPAIFGTNFQSVSTAQKLNTSNYYPTTDAVAKPRQGLGGYGPNGDPGPVLEGALAFVDVQLGKLLAAVGPAHTALIVSAKHGQSPRLRRDLLIIDDDAMLGALNAAWTTEHRDQTKPLVAHAVDDDGVVLWLQPHTEEAAQFASRFLMQYRGSGVGSDDAGQPMAKTFEHAGLRTIYAGRRAAGLMTARTDDDRVPDLIGFAQPGAIWAGHKLSKIAEHGGHADEDRHVPLLLWGPGIRAGVDTKSVETTQIAPTILRWLQLPAAELEAVRIDNTRPLPDAR